MMQRCSICKIEKALENFSPVKARKSGRSSWCRPCRNERTAQRYDPTTRRNEFLRSKYGFSLEKYEAMHEGQSGVCAICEEPPRATMTGRNRKLVATLHVDHDHTTNQVRALLCQNCNVAIGALRERIDLLPKVEAYLRRFG